MMGKPLVILMLCAGLAHAAGASKPLPSPERKVVGDAAPLSIRPDLGQARATAEGKQLWTDNVARPGASFLKVHLSDVNLRKGDRLTLINGNGRVIEHITERGPKNRGSFWALSGQGDNLILQFEFQNDYAEAPFLVDSVIIGNDAMFGKPRDSGSRSICSPADFEDSVCYEGDTGKWTNARASVGVMSVGGNAATAMYCSGANISGSNTILTNQHCVENQADCDNTEYVFDAYTTQCGVAAPLSEWTSYRCDTVLAAEPFINCDAAPGDLDFALTTVQGDPASLHGFVQVDSTPITSGEEIYIVQHPDGRPQEITVGSGADVEVDGTVLRYYNTLDTEGGSSGSPIFRASDNKLIGLHHCGGCTTAGVGNRGMLISDILPLIDEFLCAAGSIDLRVAGLSVPVEVAGNGDGVVDPGEQWSFTVTALNNSCDTAATGVTADVSISSGNATLGTTTLNFGDLAAGISVASAPVVFTIPADAPCGDTVVFDIDQVADNNGATFDGRTNALSVTSGEQAPELIAGENFANGLIAWTIEDGGTGTGAAATWTTTNPGGRSLTLTAPYAIVDSDELGSGAAMDEGLISPIYDVTGYDSVLLEFVHDFNHYTGGQPERGDVEVRSGATAGQWVNVAAFLDGDASGAVS
ncbi:MAG: trypsin-like peptidase domain-containing protein, partial [Gammaproteobacteria bacterium]